MVIVEPYRWIKSTAIKERLDLANKLNEVIDVLNGGVVTIEDIDLTVSSDGIFTFVFTLSDGAVKEMSFNMGDYIDNTVASAISSALTDYATKSYVDTKDSQNIKKTGISTVTGDIRVPTTPPNPLSVVNSLYVNDSSAGVNNIMHKTGDEIINGKKTFNQTIFIGGSQTKEIFGYSINNEEVFKLTSGNVNADITAHLLMKVNNDGTISLVLQKRKLSDNSYINQTIIATL